MGQLENMKSLIAGRSCHSIEIPFSSGPKPQTLRFRHSTRNCWEKKRENSLMMKNNPERRQPRLFYILSVLNIVQLGAGLLLLLFRLSLYALLCTINIAHDWATGSRIVAVALSSLHCLLSVRLFLLTFVQLWAGLLLLLIRFYM